VSVTVRPASSKRTLKASTAVAAVAAVNRLSRALGRGSGTVAGGRAGLAIDPDLLATLAQGHRVALVSGTNGKTTTTRMLAAVLAGPNGTDPVVSNDTGANMPAGHVAALAGGTRGAPVVLEVDEGYLGRVVEATSPEVVVLLNLSRDQLDRISEVRMLVDRWRTALGALPRPTPGRPGTVVVANADDPMVAWAANSAPDVRWVGAGQVWQDDAVGCPACGGRITFEEDGAWRCDRCAFARPEVVARLDEDDLVLADGSRHPVAITLPGRFNRANAVMVAVAGAVMIDDERGGIAEALSRAAHVEEVAGRFATVQRSGHDVRLLLAKNPAGWTAIFDLVDEEGPPTATSPPLVLSINARIADGKDTSWLWDVPFERLMGRTVVATGERRLDLAVRLRYAEVAHTVVAAPLDALDHAVRMARADGQAQAGSHAQAMSPGQARRQTGEVGGVLRTEEPREADHGSGTGEAGSDGATDSRAVQFLGNYTAFADLRSAL
jgi:UDP-N-acetylmuramyl tripeptide synthase